MGLRTHYLFDLLVTTAGLLTLIVYWFRSSRSWVRLVILGVAAIVLAGAVLAPMRIGNRFPNGFVQWTRSLSIFVTAWVLFSIPVLLALRAGQRFQPGRRKALKAAAAVALGSPAVIGAAAFINRERLTFREVEIAIPGLPKDLNGLRLVQLSDIHLSPFVTERLLIHAVGLANETRADLALVTGDLVSRLGDPLDTCLKHLATLRSTAGTYGCMGNHEIYASAEGYTKVRGARLGLDFLRGESRPLLFGDAVLNLVGVDYQRRGSPYLTNTAGLLVPGATNVLLSHNPDVFPVAASQGYDLTVSGHTHGGQINFEILERGVNIARFFTPYVYGSYERDGQRLFVTRGIGTVGAPARLGAPPEVALIRLRAI